MDQLISRQFEYLPEIVNSLCVCDRGGRGEWVDEVS